jgi:hypothetical protein
MSLCIYEEFFFHLAAPPNICKEGAPVLFWVTAWGFSEIAGSSDAQE